MPVETETDAGPIEPGDQAMEDENESSPIEASSKPKARTLKSPMPIPAPPHASPISALVLGV
eukprot:6464970-Amphidinium_carterae.3